MTARDRERYSRQILFPGLGEGGQERLLAAHAAVIGCGALGTVQAMALVRAGVGRVTLIDRDYVEFSNLQRQTLYDEADAEAALPKAVAAAAHLRRMNSGVTVESVVDDLDARNVEELLGQPGVLLDATDNFEARFLINDYAVSRSIPWVYGAAVGSYGLVMPVLPGETACLRCVYPEPPGGAQPTCDTAGVLGPLTGVVGNLQAAMALQILSGAADAVPRRITMVDVWTGPLRQIEQPPRDAECPCCGARRFDWLSGAAGRAPISLCGRNAVQIHERRRPLDLERLRANLAPLGEVRANEFALRFFPAPYEMTIFPDGRAIVKGTTDPGVARGLYARYVGM